MATNYEVSKVRNEIRFTREDGKYWYIDLNTGEKHGFSGKVVSRYPNGAKTCMNDYVCFNKTIEANLISLILMNRNYKDVSSVERLYMAGAAHLTTRHGWGLNFDIFTLFTFKQIVKVMLAIEKNIEEEEEKDEYTLDAIYRRLYTEQVTSKYQKYVDRYGEETFMSMANAYKRHGWNEDPLPENDFDIYLYYVCDNKINILRDTWISDYTLYERAKDIIRWCNKMGIKPHKSCIIEEYPRIEKAYKAWKNKARNKVFAASQQAAWGYENENFVAIVPTTIEELTQEGAALRNCLGGYWLDGYGNDENHFARGVVFIHNKSHIDEPFIACDFRKSDMNIMQFLGKNNSYISDSAARDFRAELQEHLWNCR